MAWIAFILDYESLIVALPAAYLLDLIIGDPRGWPHPVRAIGWLVSRCEVLWRRILPWEHGAGALLVLSVLAVTAAIVIGFRAVVHGQDRWVRIVVDAVLIRWGLATRSLAGETLRVVRAAERGDWAEARRELSMIVGRDTESLVAEDVNRACIETVAENTTDAVVSPLLFAALTGPVGLWLFKAASTMDSMIGHRDARYVRFGWAAARLDDVLNFVPARITLLIMPLAAFFSGGRPLAAWRIGWRDGRKHASPNAGVAEATMAGALGVALGGPATYDGVSVDRPIIGDPAESPSAATVRRAIAVMLVTSLFAFVLAEATVALGPFAKFVHAARRETWPPTGVFNTETQP